MSKSSLSSPVSRTIPLLNENTAMNDFASTEPELPPEIYRRFLMLTCAWPGTRALPGSLVIKFKSGGSDEPLFWCGGPDNLYAIGETLAEKRPIFYMRGTYGVLPPTLEVVQTLGSYYASEIIKIQPDGAYQIGGFCEAGLIAYEIAQILMARGHQVKLLVLFERDLNMPADGYWLSIAKRVYSLIDRSGYHWKRFRQVQSDGKCNFFKYLYSILYKRISPVDLLGQSCHVKAPFPTDTNPIPCSQEETPYSLRPYPGSAVFIYIRWGPFGYFRFRTFQKYWDKIVFGGTDFRIITGYSHYMPNWPLFAEKLDILLGEGENSGQHEIDLTGPS